MFLDNDVPNDQDQRRARLFSDLAAYQQSETWDRQRAMTVCHRWANRFNDKFKLGISEIAIQIDVLPVSQLGSFRGEHNGFGLQHVVSINSLYLNSDRPRWEPFSTVLHQLLHGWQFCRNIIRPTYVHDAEYRSKAAELGLAVTVNGLTGCIPGGPFHTLLAEHGIVVAPDVIIATGLPESELPPRADSADGSVRPCEKRLKGESKLRKYSCGCTNVRVAKKEFRALCLLCGNEFLYEKRDEVDDSVSDEI